MKKILLLGGDGFLGNNLQNQMLINDFRITVLSRSQNKFFPNIKDIEYIYDDFNKHQDIEVQKYDYVIHLVGSSNPLIDDSKPSAVFNDSLNSSIEILQRLSNSQAHFIYISSGGAIYGDQEEPLISEKSKIQPVNFYGQSKKIYESYINFFSRNYGLKSSIVRPGNVYGPGQSFKCSQGIISKFIYQTLKSEEIAIWNDGTFIRDYIYVDDFSKMIVKLINTNKTGTYNVGSGIGYSVLDILSIIEDKIDLKSKRNFIKSPFKNVKKIILDISKAKKELNWLPEVSIDEGIQLTYDWIKKTI